MTCGGGDFCDDCAWPDCQGVGFCLRPFASPVAALGLPLSQAELLELADELAKPATAPIWIGYDPSGPAEVVVVMKPTDLGNTSSPFVQLVRADELAAPSSVPGPFTHSPDDILSSGSQLAAATERLTGDGESPVAASAMPADPLQDGGGATSFSIASPPPTAGATC
nr:hypothetical protein [uncultured Brevundimonas sp.]